MKRILAALLLVMSCARSAAASTFEYASLSFSDKGIVWTDKDGLRTDSNGDLFADLSGQDRKLSGTAQRQILVLNGLSKKGWELVSVTDAPTVQKFWLKHGAAGTAPATSSAVGPAGLAKPAGDESRLPLVFTGGHETDPRDGGRPVVLVAAGLGVEPQVFRDAFSRVHPAPPGSGGPTDAEVRQNKTVLLDALGKYGVTDDELNTVSNFYRYAKWKGEMWKNTPASGYATVRDGKVTGFVLTNPGAGYSSPPSVAVEGMADVKATASLLFGKDLNKNGSIKEITVVAPAGRP